MSKKRLFIAIALPESLTTALEDLQKKLKRFARDAKWVKVSGIHLTLKFLGYVEPERIPAIEESLKLTLQDTAPFSVKVKGCGFFPNARRPNVLWAGVGSSELLPLQQRIEESMSRLGFEKETRPFSPHLTVARFKDYHGLLPLAHETEKFHDESFGVFQANTIVLFESVLHREGAEYFRLHEYRLTTAH